MPVLARTLEAASLSTVLVTPMPYWVERIGAPRTLAVEYPFGHTLGQPHDREGQRSVILQALDVLKSAQKPGTIVHSSETWPEPVDQAIKAWQPSQASPIIREMAPHIRQLLRQRRARK